MSFTLLMAKLDNSGWLARYYDIILLLRTLLEKSSMAIAFHDDVGGGKACP